MRRALLLIAALAVPLGAAAQIDAPPNTLIEVENYNTRPSPPTSYLNKAMCDDAAGTPQVKLEWNIPGANSGTYQIYATDLDPAQTASPDTGSCLTRDTTIASTDHFGGAIGNSITVNSAVQQATVSGAALSDAASGTQQACASDRTVIFVCAHWFDANNNARVGVAIGRFQVQLAAPAKTSIRSVGPGPGLLDVSWNLGDAVADHYVVTATPIDEVGADLATPPTVSSGNVTGSSVKVTGLTNGQRYKVVVQAFSVGGNPSELSDPQFGTPTDVDDFWDVYKSAGGQEKGGCGAGPAGPAALLAVAGLLAVLRRRK